MKPHPNIPMLVKKYGVVTGKEDVASLWSPWFAKLNHDGKTFLSGSHSSKRRAVLAVLAHFNLPLE